MDGTPPFPSGMDPRFLENLQRFTSHAFQPFHPILGSAPPHFQVPHAQVLTNPPLSSLSPLGKRPSQMLDDDLEVLDSLLEKSGGRKKGKCKKKNVEPKKIILVKRRRR